MHAARSKVVILLAALALSTLQAVRAADEPTEGQAARSAGGPVAAGWTKLTPVDLLAIRGGLDTPTDVSIAFGIERAVGLGPNLSAVSAPGQGSLSGLSPLLSSTAVQNQLNNERIQVVTIINATVTELSVLRGLALQTAIQDTAATSLHR